MGLLAEDKEVVELFLFFFGEGWWFWDVPDLEGVTRLVFFCFFFWVTHHPGEEGRGVEHTG